MDIKEQFKREGKVLGEQEYNLIAEDSSNVKVVDEAITSLKRKGNLRIVQFLQASNNYLTNGIIN